MSWSSSSWKTDLFILNMSQQLISISFQSTYLVLPWCCCLCYLLSCCGCLCSAACAAVPLLPLLCCLCCLCSAFSAAATWFAPRPPPTSSRAAPPRWPVACRTAARPPGAPRHEGPPRSARTGSARRSFGRLRKWQPEISTEKLRIPGVGVIRWTHRSQTDCRIEVGG